ncbi:hypothetical protein FEM03_18465 [Phragmitibacter flavus]|uniref:Uncharacterized protein n=1 Tax=Phragmitibacter flavus TaxID=2576071 RepID=A0A5R8KAL9_9BACT|nr:hypothetical protein [Phragmitibacter flavus]TLD69353.1 hypothetical protein FEM03_18465 [Phragmitibacter flavus]
MKSHFVGISMCLLVFCASEQARAATDPELDRVIGKVFLILAEQYTVSGQSHGQLSLWANAKLGSVAYPESKAKDAKTRWETEMIPTESGIVLKFNPPFNPDEMPIEWMNYHDDEAKKFVILVPLPGREVISIMGNYGPSFPRKYVDQLIELSKFGK